MSISCQATLDTLSNEQNIFIVGNSFGGGILCVLQSDEIHHWQPIYYLSGYK